MTYTELNADQRYELKQRYLVEQAEENGWGDPSLDELADADKIVSDFLMEQYHRGTEFTDDDFFCTAGKEQNQLGYGVYEIAYNKAIEPIDEMLIVRTMDKEEAISRACGAFNSLSEYDKKYRLIEVRYNEYYDDCGLYYYDTVEAFGGE